MIFQYFFALVEKCLQPGFFLLFSPPVEFMQNLNTYKGKDVLITTLHTTVKVIFFGCTFVNMKKMAVYI